MTFDFILGALVAAGLLVYLGFALLRPSASDRKDPAPMDSSGLIQIVLYLVLLTALTPVTRRVHGARLQRREDGR